MKRRVSVKQKLVKKFVAQDEEELEELTEKLSKVEIEKVQEKPKVEEKKPKPVQDKPKLEEKKPKKKSVPTPKIEPLIPGSESAEDMVSEYRKNSILNQLWLASFDRYESY